MTATIYCEDYMDTVERLYRAGERVDLVLTSGGKVELMTYEAYD